jgi:hypothetical protein
MLLGYGEKSAVPDPGRNSLPPLKLGATQVSSCFQNIKRSLIPKNLKRDKILIMGEGTERR